MKFSNLSVRRASAQVIQELLHDGGIGGVIAVDSEGNGAQLTSPLRGLPDDLPLSVATPLNCPGMYRGVIREDGDPKTAIFREDVL